MTTPPIDRGAFEKWQLTQGWELKSFSRLIDGRCAGEYENSGIERDWKIWQAALTSAPVGLTADDYMDKFHLRTGTLSAKDADKVHAALTAALGVSHTAADRSEVLVPFCWWRSELDICDEYETVFSKDGERPDGNGWQPLYSAPILAHQSAKGAV